MYINTKIYFLKTSVNQTTCSDTKLSTNRLQLSGSKFSGGFGGKELRSSIFVSSIPPKA